VHRQTRPISRERIAERAKQIWLHNGSPEGTAESDWARAESELEAARGADHQVTAFVRDASRIPADHQGAKWVVADLFDTNRVAEVIAGQDVVISSYGPARGGDPHLVVKAAHAVLEAFGRRPGLRVIVVGGAGSLEVAPGKTVIDAGLIPEEFLPIPKAAKQALELFRANHKVSWTYFSPAALIRPGERTGKFRLGNDQLVVGADGKSTISCEDYALAMIDEAEHPLHIQKRFTIGY
jgi:putative NADH-flavin reductase